MRRQLLSALAILAAANAHALDICKYIKDGVAGCKNVNVSSGGGLPSHGSAQSLNPASIPASAPFGLEAIDSLPPTENAEAKYSFAIVKGFKRLGAGVSTDGDDTFYTHSHILAARETGYADYYDYIYQQNKKMLRSVNLGTSFEIPINRRVASIVQPSIGVLARYNVPMHQWGGGFGLNLSTRFLSLGASYVDQPNEYENTHLSMGVLMAGVGVGIVRVDYVWMDYLRGLLDDNPVTIWTVSLNFRRVIVFTGRRSEKNLANVKTEDYLYGAQYLVGRHLALGMMANYVPGRYSLGMQVYL